MPGGRVDIGDWLRGLGLERYADAFRDSDVGVDVLPDLTDADLQELGVSLGDRKRLLKAALSLREQDHGRVPPPAPHPRASRMPLPPCREPTAERRQLTVMFVDLVGSTALAGRLDPEDMSELIRAYQNAVAGEIARYQGHVAKFMGDGVLAYFGWPRSHEDEAERAVRAGLALVAAVTKLTGRPARRRLAARVGIATGLVVVGELIGEGAAKEQTVVGETPNLAARLQALASPGQCRDQRGDTPAGRVACSSSLTWARCVSKASPRRWPPGRSKARVVPRAGSRRSMASGSLRWSAESTS